MQPRRSSSPAALGPSLPDWVAGVVVLEEALVEDEPALLVGRGRELELVLAVELVQKGLDDPRGLLGELLEVRPEVALGVGDVRGRGPVERRDGVLRRRQLEDVELAAAMASR